MLTTCSIFRSLHDEKHVAEPDAGPNDEERGQPQIPLQTSWSRSSSSVSSLTMSAPPEIPPVIRPHKAITYELTRWDVFANWMTVIFRNRILQVFVLVTLLFNGWIILAPKFSTHSFSRLLFDTLVYLMEFLGCIAFFQVALGLANAFIPKHRGVLGQHVLEITEQGLVERTDCNETLHRWPSICRILSLWGYLYVYVSDTNSHQIPKRCFSPQEMDSFEADLRRAASSGHRL